MTTGRDILPKPLVRALSERSDARGAWLVLHAWAVIAGAAAVAAIWPNPVTVVLAIMVIGSRQMGLAILMHDAAHGALFRTKALNETVGTWACAYPVFADMAAYRHYHLKHHRYTQQPEDPDLVLSKPFPVTRTSFWRKAVRDLTGQTAFKQRAAQVRMTLDAQKNADETTGAVQAFGTPSLWGPLAVNAGLFAALALSGYWWVYLAFWIVPLATWYQFVLRIRNIAEHAMVPDDDDPFRNARTTHANLLERVFFAPYWVNYHVDHHLYMYVPCWQLPRLHKALGEAGMHARMETKPGYLAVLRMATSRATAPA
ncbi:fatty acid desaturase family protein [Futiania mangrovi]|uniref:Fatty acid desaturase family protein n=1 Tax=Futiania mangrovi TaxID=2959716 RepID=A0A9J6PNH6_9PROT|nr:fatty acid desaturase family protein [Futiania mangrovii]MCP1337618.1 fatty acid desaturase family protein [Futiania mangrovii]